MKKKFHKMNLGNVIETHLRTFMIKRVSKWCDIIGVILTATFELRWPNTVLARAFADAN